MPISKDKFDRSKQFPAIVSAKFKEASFFTKIQMVLQFIGFMVLKMVPHKLLESMGRVSKNGMPEEVMKNKIWIIPYTVVAANNCVIVKGKDNSLAMFSCCALEPETVDTLNRLGNLTTIVLNSSGHEEYVREWSKKFPNVQVLCAESVKEWFQQSCKITHTFEQADGKKILESFGLTAIPTPYATMEETWFKVEDGKRCGFISGCGVQDGRKSGWSDWILGFGDLRFFRMFGLFFAKSPRHGYEFFYEFSKRKEDWEVGVFLHGPPCYGPNIGSLFRKSVEKYMPQVISEHDSGDDDDGEKKQN